MQIESQTVRARRGLTKHVPRPVTWDVINFEAQRRKFQTRTRHPSQPTCWSEILQHLSMVVASCLLCCASWLCHSCLSQPSFHHGAVTRCADGATCARCGGQGKIGISSRAQHHSTWGGGVAMGSKPSPFNATCPSPREAHNEVMNDQGQENRQRLKMLDSSRKEWKPVSWVLFSFQWLKWKLSF